MYNDGIIEVIIVVLVLYYFLFLVGLYDKCVDEEVVKYGI